MHNDEVEDNLGPQVQQAGPRFGLPTTVRMLTHSVYVIGHEDIYK